MPGDHNRLLPALPFPLRTCVNAPFSIINQIHYSFLYSCAVDIAVLILSQFISEGMVKSPPKMNSSGPVFKTSFTTLLISSLLPETIVPFPSMPPINGFLTFFLLPPALHSKIIRNVYDYSSLVLPGRYYSWELF